MYIILNIKIELNPFWINTCHNLMIIKLSERSTFACIYAYCFFHFCKSYDSLTLTRSLRVFAIFSKFFSLSLIEILCFHSSMEDSPDLSRVLLTATFLPVVALLVVANVPADRKDLVRISSTLRSVLCC